MKYFTTCFIGIMLVIFGANIVSGEEPQSPHHTIGLMANVAELSTAMAVPYRFHPRVTVIPTFQFLQVEQSGSDYGVGIDVRYYLRTQGVLPYGGIGGGLFVNSPESGESLSDTYWKVFFGGEYFVFPHLSTGIELQLTQSQSDNHSVRFGNPGGTVMNTGASLYLSLYF